MAFKVREVMTAEPVMLPLDTTLAIAAQFMRDQDIGDVLAVDDGLIRGVVTDRDIVVRAVAMGMDPALTTLADICTTDPICVGPEDDVDDAVLVMRDRAIRRLPVTTAGHPLGVVSLGDMAVAQDRRSALADISVAPPSR